MADETENQKHDADGQPASPTQRGGGRGLIIAFVAVVILMETGMFFFLVPSADEVSALAEAKLIKSVQEGEAAAEVASIRRKQGRRIQTGDVRRDVQPHRYRTDPIASKSISYGADSQEELRTR